MRQKSVARPGLRAGIIMCVLAFILLFSLSAIHYRGISTTAQPTAVGTQNNIQATAQPTGVDTESRVPPPLPPAFPGAEGWGAQSIGGRGGRVIEVTNLRDAGSGSLRACVEASNPRICVFRVNGIIRLRSSIEIRNPYLTIAGQTAPGSGIYIRSASTNEEGINGLIKFPEYDSSYTGEFPHDVIIRYLRIRHGRSPTQKFNGTRPRNLDILSGYNIIVDHVSSGWVQDNLMTIMAPDKDGLPPIQYITIQRTILAESLEGHSTGLNIQGEGDGDRWKDVRNITVHHNLFADNGERNPRVTSAGAKVFNNVAYNWNNHVGSTIRGSVIDWINNYWKFGPNSKSTEILLHEDRPGNNMPLYPSTPSIYIAGNIVDPEYPDSDIDNWPLYSLRFNDFAALPGDYRRYTPLPSAPITETVQSAVEAYHSVLDDVGANKRLDCMGNWVFNLDLTDARVIDQVRNDTGFEKTLRDEDQVGGFPETSPAPACPDSDHDGMPDEWEQANGFNPTATEDNSQDADADGYTNIEEFLNGGNPRDTHR
jgi:pectate lyase